MDLGEGHGDVAKYCIIQIAKCEHVTVIKTIVQGIGIEYYNELK